MELSGSQYLYVLNSFLYKKKEIKMHVIKDDDSKEWLFGSKYLVS